MQDAACPAVDPWVQPCWMRTGYKFFPYAARHADRSWVLRVNYDFPAHEMFTLFIGGRAAADVTGRYIHRIPLAASIGALKPFTPDSAVPTMDSKLAETIVRAVARYVVYGSEADDPCFWCDHLAHQDPMTKA